MKKRKSNNKISIKKVNNKFIFIVSIIFLIILLLFIFSIKFTGNVVGQITGQVTGDATSTSLYTCEDSDNGINYFEKGICKDKKQEYTDGCYSAKGLWEYYCPMDNYACIRQEAACPYGCEDGACKKILCTDSDDGKDYYVKGTVDLNNIEHEDYCLSDNLSVSEYYCSGDSKYNSLTFECENGCSDGACISNSAIIDEDVKIIPEDNIQVRQEPEKNPDYILITAIVVFIAALIVLFLKKFKWKKK